MWIWCLVATKKNPEWIMLGASLVVASTWLSEIGRRVSGDGAAAQARRCARSTPLGTRSCWPQQGHLVAQARALEPTRAGAGCGFHRVPPDGLRLRSTRSGIDILPLGWRSLRRNPVVGGGTSRYFGGRFPDRADPIRGKSRPERFIGSPINSPDGRTRGRDRSEVRHEDPISDRIDRGVCFQRR